MGIPRCAPLLLLFPANPLRWASPGYLRPCVERTLQNSMGLTLPVRFQNLACFTGDTLYPHHDKLQNLFLMPLTAVARRGRPMRAAAESKGMQRGGAAGAGTTAHNWETQARKDSGGDVPFSDHPGPGRPGRRGSRVRFCAPDVKNISPIGLPLGPGPQARRTLATFLLWKVARPGRNIPIPSSRPQAILPRGRRGDDSPCRGEMAEGQRGEG